MFSVGWCAANKVRFLGENPAPQKDLRCLIILEEAKIQFWSRWLRIKWEIQWPEERFSVRHKLLGHRVVISWRQRSCAQTNSCTWAVRAADCTVHAIWIISIVVAVIVLYVPTHMPRTVLSRVLYVPRLSTMMFEKYWVPTANRHRLSNHVFEFFDIGCWVLRALSPRMSYRHAPIVFFWIFSESMFWSGVYTRGKCYTCAHSQHCWPHDNRTKDGKEQWSSKKNSSSS